MPLTGPPQLIEQSTDDDGRLRQMYKLECTNDAQGNPTENVESIKLAYDNNGIGLPKKYTPNPFRKEGQRQTFLYDINPSHRGEDYNVFSVTLGWQTPADINDRERDKVNEGKYLYPWEQPAEYSSEPTSVQEFLAERDKRGQPTVFSNGEPITGLGQSTPITVITITRNRLATDTPISPQLSEDFYQTVNDGPVDINGVSYEARRVLVESFPLKLERFIETNELTGDTKTTKYYSETLRFAVKKNTWATRVTDQGNFYSKDPVPNGKKTAPIEEQIEQRLDNGIRKAGPFNLSGGGQALGDPNNGDGIVDSTFSGNGGSTPQGVEIDEANSDEYSTTLAFMFFEEVDFGPMDINKGLDI